LYVLAFPAIQDANERRVEEANNRLNENALSYQDRLDRQTQEIAEILGFNNELKDDVRDLEVRLDTRERTNRVLTAYIMVQESRHQDAVDMTEGLDTSGLPSDIIEKRATIDIIAFPLLAQQYYDAGRRAFDTDGDFAKALVDFEKAYRYVDTETAAYMPDLLFYLARLYARNESTYIQAYDYLTVLRERYPNFNRNGVTSLYNEVSAAVGDLAGE
jgi:tetratricopeptide (TPR) repeat protein